MYTCTYAYKKEGSRAQITEIGRPITRKAQRDEKSSEEGSSEKEGWEKSTTRLTNVVVILTTDRGTGWLSS